MLKSETIIIGGGAAGFFAAITCAAKNPSARVGMIEKGQNVLGKVKISGGGRCNVTNAKQNPKELTQNYPRGSKELLGPFYKFGSKETIKWFTDRGVTLKTEAEKITIPNRQIPQRCLQES